MSALQTLNAGRLDVTSGGLIYSQQTLAAMQANAAIPAATVLGAVQDFFTDMINDRAETLRESYLTPGQGQVMEYQELQSEATAALAAPTTASAALYPMLAATIGIDIDPQTKTAAVDVVGVARAVNAAYQAFLTAGSAIRAARMKGCAAVSAATTIAAAAAAVDAIVWPPASS